MRKKPFTRPEWHSIITSYGSLALSVVAIILSAVSMYQSYVVNNRENIQILNVEDDGYYHFDGETLLKNFNITIANNSAIPVSIVNVKIERNGEPQDFGVTEIPEILPLNMEISHTKKIAVPFKINLTDEQREKLVDFTLGEERSDSDIICSSRLFTYGSGGRRMVTVNPNVSLSIMVKTAKNNTFILASTDKVAGIDGENEGDWVIGLIASERSEQLEYGFGGGISSGHGASR